MGKWTPDYTLQGVTGNINWEGATFVDPGNINT